MAAKQPLLPTSVVGSYAWPSWLWSGIEAARRGEFGSADWQEMLDDAGATALRDQEEAGVDIPSDGEMRLGRLFHCRVLHSPERSVPLRDCLKRGTEPG